MYLFNISSALTKAAVVAAVTLFGSVSLCRISVSLESITNFTLQYRLFLIKENLPAHENFIKFNRHLNVEHL
jgi:hypothetical protein